MLRRIAGWIVLVPLSALLIVFALANRHPVLVNFNPTLTADQTVVPSEGAGVPLFLLIYAVLLIGVLLGGVSAWFSQGHHRAEKRRWRREVDALNREIDLLRRRSAREDDRAALIDVDDLMGNG
jgi:uncharacterized integral membrane protein